MKVTAIIVAAGKGSRFGSKQNKVFADLNGQPVLWYSLKAFEDNLAIDEIILTIHPLDRKKVDELLASFPMNKKVIVVNGGNTRTQSVYNSLIVASGDIVIIQDGARPMIRQEYIKGCLEDVSNFKGVAIAVKTKDTIKITDDNGVVETTTKRANTWLVQTPQCFDRKTLLDAHQKHVNNENITDDCMFLELERIGVKLREGHYDNIKVTTVEDLHILNTLK